MQDFMNTNKNDSRNADQQQLTERQQQFLMTDELNFYRAKRSQLIQDLETLEQKIRRLELLLTQPI